MSDLNESWMERQAQERAEEEAWERYWLGLTEEERETERALMDDYARKTFG